MGEYRFTGPFYTDNGETYMGGTDHVQPETVPVTPEPEPIPVAPKQEKPKTKEKKSGFGKTLLKTVCIALVAGVVAGGTFLGVVSKGYDVLGLNKPANTEKTEAITEIPQTSTETAVATTVKNSIDVTDIAKQCLPSIVSINNKGVQEIRSWFGTYQQETSGSGSGIIIGENDSELLIVTNYHVVSDSQELSVYFSFDEDENADEDETKVVGAKIKGYDSGKDLAVIAVKLADIPQEAKAQIKIATIGDSSQLEVGEQVVAIGNALGYGQSTTTGIVSALNRKVSLTGTNGESITNRLIQVDAAINPGNSGGALLNMKGEVVGINSAKLASEEVEGMGYAIPISEVKTIIGDLMNKETRDKVAEGEEGYLGIKCQDMTAEVAQAYDLPIGVYVKSVVKGSAAERAGIQPGDVIVKLEGSSVTTAAELVESLKYYKAGETVELVVNTRTSGYQEQTIQVILSSASQAGL